MTAASRITLTESVSLSRLVFGAWRLLDQPQRPTAGDVARLIAAAIDHGMTSFDHADIYGGYQVEAAFGEGLADWRGDRSKIELISKCDIMLKSPQRPHNRLKHYDTSAAHIVASVERSLKNFATDYLNVLLIHRPDPLMDADDTAAGLEKVVKDGKVRAVGVSNFLPSQLDLLRSRLSIPLVTNQIEMSVLQVAPLYDGTLDHAQQHRYSPMIWSPLGGGSLFTGQGEREERLRSTLQEVAGQTVAADISAVALAWLLRHPSRPVPVVGSMKLERLAGLARSLEVELDRQQWFDILRASEGREQP